jgi:hypothetical protein
MFEVIRAKIDRAATEIITRLQQAVCDLTQRDEPQDYLTAIVIKVETASRSHEVEAKPLTLSVGVLLSLGGHSVSFRHEGGDRPHNHFLSDILISWQGQRHVLLVVVVVPVV